MLVDRIYKHYEEQRDDTRSHLGASELGHDCERKVWLSFRWFQKPKFEGRILRLFETGQLAEQRFVDNLRAIGVIVKPLDEATGQQHRVVAYSQHFGGSIDAIVSNIDPNDPLKEYIAEFKTHNERSFNALVKDGCKVSKPEHYDQVQIYMGLSKIHQAIYIAVNKNTDELYEEIIEFDENYFVILMMKAKSIITADRPPVKISKTSSYYKCKMCPMADICHNKLIAKSQVDHNCRTCIHSEPSANGLWKCRKLDKTLDVEQQQAGCEEHEAISLEG